MDFYDRLASEALREKGIVGEEQTLGKGLRAVWQQAEDGDVRDPGRYATLLLDTDTPWDSHLRDAVCEVIGRLLATMDAAPDKVLMVGMGNPRILADRLGSAVLDQLTPTAHLTLTCPDVQTHSGLDTADAVAALVRAAGASLVVAVDTLVCRDAHHLMRSVQLSDAGLRPGGGVGRQCKPLNQTTVGVPVLYLGVPMLSFVDPYEPTLCVTKQDIEVQLSIIATALAGALQSFFGKEEA